jgi:hypothetical protein
MDMETIKSCSHQSTNKGVFGIITKKTSQESVSIGGGFAAQGALFWWGINEVPWIKQVKGSVNTSVPFLLQEKDLG